MKRRRLLQMHRSAECQPGSSVACLQKLAGPAPGAPGAVAAILLLLALSATTPFAQSDSAPGATPATVIANSTNAPTQIFSDTVDFDLKTRVAVYRGNVRVEDTQMRLWCGMLTATAPTGGGRIEKIVAETNVVMLLPDDKGVTNRATGQKLVYTYNVLNGVTNELAVLTGEPKLEKPDTIIYGDEISLDRANNQLRVKNQRMVFQTNEPGATNSPSSPLKNP